MHKLHHELDDDGYPRRPEGIFIGVKRNHVLDQCGSLQVGSSLKLSCLFTGVWKQLAGLVTKIQEFSDDRRPAGKVICFRPCEGSILENWQYAVLWIPQSGSCGILTSWRSRASTEESPCTKLQELVRFKGLDPFDTGLGQQMYFWLMKLLVAKIDSEPLFNEVAEKILAAETQDDLEVIVIPLDRSTSFDGDDLGCFPQKCAECALNRAELTQASGPGHLPCGALPENPYEVLSLAEEAESREYLQPYM